MRATRTFKNRIQDILDAIVEIQSFTDGMAFEDFLEDRKTVRAVLYNMAIIGEAAATLMPDIEQVYPEIPWVEVRGMRNIVVREYFQVNLEIIWQTIQEDLSPLASSLQELLE